MKVTETEQRDFLLSCAAWQDSLLQSYRSFHVTMQSFLIAAGAAVLAIQLTGAVQDQSARPIANVLFNLLFTTLLVALFWLQRKTSAELEGVVTSRAADINFWHVETILSENALEPTQRAFTHFKCWQQANRSAVAPDIQKYLPPEGLIQSVAEDLVGNGLGHARRVLDFNLFKRLQHLWIGLCIVSTAVSVWFIAAWYLA
jgi:uncharacterized membrane protein